MINGKITLLGVFTGILCTESSTICIYFCDGHSSRFDYKILRFLKENKINMFVSPPDTTGVTQLLDQAPNSKLHQGYNSTKDKLFFHFKRSTERDLWTFLVQCGMNGPQKRT